MKNIKLIIITFVLVTVSGVSWYIYNDRCQAKNKNPFTIEQPAKRDLVQFVTATGNLKAKDQITVGSLVSGRVMEILAEDNDIVKQDQVLTVIDNGIGDASIKRLKAALVEFETRFDYQEKFFKRQEALYKSGQLSKNLYEQYKQDYIVAQSKVDQTKAELQLETQTYNNLFIKAPTSGIVIARKVNLGQTVTSQLDATVLFEIAKDLHSMEAYIDVDEADIGLVKEEQCACFTVDAFPKDRFGAKVKRIQYLAKIVDNVVTYAVVLDVPNPDLRLRPGMTTNVDLQVAEAQQTLSISNKAFRVNTIQLEQAAKNACFTVNKITETIKAGTPRQHKTKDFLWILENDKTIKQIEVKIGINDGKFTQIMNGIDTNTKIIVDLSGIATENVLLKGLFGKPGGIGR